MAEIIPLPVPAERTPARPASSRDPEPLWRELVGDQLRRRRHARGETLTETAERAGVSPQYLSEIERGLKDPSSEMIAAVAGALETTLIELASDVADELRQAVPTAARRGAFALAA